MPAHRRVTNLRRIVCNGNSTHVSVPQQFLDRLRWRQGDYVVLELLDVDRLSVRLARVVDFRAPDAPVPIDPAPAKVNA